MQYNDLTPEEKHVIEDAATEYPYSGEYEDFFEDGTFICRRCNNPLYSSEAKFNAYCGWPAFESCFPDAILEENMGDSRTEITCANCAAHLGHVFRNEGFTKTNVRHCTNSLSIRFVAEGEELPAVIHGDAE